MMKVLCTFFSILILAGCQSVVKKSEIESKTKDNYALYSNRVHELPADKIREIANPQDFYITKTNDGSKSHVYVWNDLKITINQMPVANMPKHLSGFSGYITHLSNKKGIQVNSELVNRIMSTTMVLGVIVEPGIDPEGRAEEVIGAITSNTDSIMFFSDGIYDSNANLIIGP